MKLLTILKHLLYTLFSKRGFYIPEGMTVSGSVNSDIPGQITGVVNGDVTLNGNLAIFNNAVINGNVTVNGRLAVLKNATINGNVNVQQLETWGRITGYVQCSGKAMLGKESFIKGNIRTAEIHIEKDAVLEGIVIKPDQHSTEEQLEHINIEEIQVPKQEPISNQAENKGEHNWF